MSTPNDPTHGLRVVPLKDTGIPAYYISLLIDRDDIHKFLTLLDSTWSLSDERKFNNLPVKRYENHSKKQDLIFCKSAREFNSITLQMITNSIDFLNAIHREKFAVPPPWIAFDACKASWWSANMQGAQGYYNDNYFFAFFTNLSDVERHVYYARYSAADEWISSLELMCDD